MDSSLQGEATLPSAAGVPAEAVKPVAATARMYFLDNLRGFVILLVVLLHGIMCYMAYAPQWWYVVDKQQSFVFLIMVLLIDVPIMPAMFFIAGYFALPSLLRHGAGAFLRDKLIRVGIPWVFGVVFLAPLVTYMIYFSRQVPMGYLEFWRTDFWGKMYQQSVYWFLGVLLALFAGLTVAFALNPRLRGARRQALAPSPWLFVAFVVIMSLPALVLSRSFPMDAWTNNRLFVYQPWRVALYVGYFLLGVFADRRCWFTADGYKPNLPLWIILSVMSGLAYLSLRLAGVGATAASLSPATIAVVVLFNVFCLSALLAGVALFRRYVNGAGPGWSSLAANSYGIYYVHPLILFPLAYLLVGTSWPLLVKAVVDVGLTIILSWGVSALLLNRAPLLRDMF